MNTWYGYRDHVETKKNRRDKSGSESARTARWEGANERAKKILAPTSAAPVHGFESC